MICTNESFVLRRPFLLFIVLMSDYIENLTQVLMPELWWDAVYVLLDRGDFP